MIHLDILDKSVDQTVEYGITAVDNAADLSFSHPSNHIRLLYDTSRYIGQISRPKLLNTASLQQICRSVTPRIIHMSYCTKTKLLDQSIQTKFPSFCKFKRWTTSVHMAPAMNAFIEERLSYDQWSFFQNQMIFLGYFDPVNTFFW